MTRAVRVPLSREVVADTALAICEADGLDSVTVRRVADALHVTPMALYWHFQTKEDLLAGMGDRILDRVVTPESVGSWSEDLRAVLETLVNTLHLQPQMAAIVTTRMLVHPTGLALSELSISALDAAGFPIEEAAWLGSLALKVALALATEGSVNSGGMSADDRAALRRRQRAELIVLDPQKYPAIAKHAEALVYCEDPARLFQLGIDHYMIGVESLALRAKSVDAEL